MIPYIDRVKSCATPTTPSATSDTGDGAALLYPPDPGVSPRTEIPCNPMSASLQEQTGLLHEAGPVGLPGNGDAAIIIGRHKLLMYNVTQSLWQSPNYPNGTVIDTYDWKYVVECTTPTKPACLFDIISVRQDMASRFGHACASG